jgi:hypothetical protein
MLGAVSGGFIQGNPVYDFDNHDYFGACIQDDWKVRPSLSLFFGVREIDRGCRRCISTR